MTRFDEVMAKIRDDAKAPLTSGEGKISPYKPKKTDSETLAEVVDKVEGVASSLITLSVLQDVHMALHLIEAPASAMGSAALLHVLCQARSRRLELVPDLGLAELDQWAQNDLPVLLDEYGELWEGER